MVDIELATVAITVPKPAKKAAEWYRDNLDFDIGGEIEGHWVVVGPKGTTGVPEGPWYGIHLCEADELDPGNTAILFLTEDIQSTYEELKTKGVKFTKELTEEVWGTYAIFTDPWGNEYWLMPRE